jgi:RNA polymerase-binding transcription factor DksA
MLTQTELETFRQQLFDLGKRLQGNVSGLSGETLRKAGGETRGNLSNMPLHLADLGSDTYEQEVALSLLENEEQRLEEVAAALDRIDRGTFGRCEACQKEIGKERLRAIPFTRYCIACARRLQDQASPENL